MNLPSPGMTIDLRRTALVITDLQNNFLSPGGIAWGLVADCLAENNIESIETLLRAARRHHLPVFISLQSGDAGARPERRVRQLGRHWG
jgi:nicotinamidase-related amidase